MALAKETTWGTGVNPTVGLAITDGGIVPQLPATYDNGRRGVASRDFAAVLDSGQGEATINGWVYPLSIGHFLMAMFGADTITGAADPYSHEFAIANTVPSYTIEEDVVSGTNGGIRSVGSRISSLGFSYESASGVLQYTSTWMGKIPALVTATNPAITSELPFESYLGTLTSTDFDCKAVSADITFTRDLHVEHTGCGTRDPYAITAGQVGIEGTVTLAVENMDEFTKFLASTTQSFTLSFTKGTPARSITFLLTTAFFGNSPLEYDRGQAGLRARLGFRGIHNATDAGPGIVTIQNSQAAAY